MRFPDTTLMLLHAFPLDDRLWDSVRNGLSSRVAKLVTPSQRGFGGVPLGADEPDLDRVAEDVIKCMAGGRVVLGGCSMGGYVAMAVLRAVPDQVAGLLLVSTRASADTDIGRANRHAMADRLDREGPGFLPDAVLPTLLGAETLERRESVVDSVRTIVADQDGAAVSWAQRAMAARPDASELLRATDVPTLIVRGEQDTLIPADEADALVALMPKAELVVLAGAGHLPPLEVPEEFTGAVARWLE
jgi:pimeloyl-ACP methyl ester carboxylesterase